MVNQHCNQYLIKLLDVFAGSQTSFKRSKNDFVQLDRDFQVLDVKLLQNVKKEKKKRITFNIWGKDF